MEKWHIVNDKGCRRVLKTIPENHRESCAFWLDCHDGFDSPRPCDCGTSIVIIEDWTTEKDAAILAAAPELLDALKLANSCMRCGSMSDSYLSDNTARMEIEAAIAKADSAPPARAKTGVTLKPRAHQKIEVLTSPDFPGKRFVKCDYRKPILGEFCRRADGLIFRCQVVSGGAALFDILRELPADHDQTDENTGTQDHLEAEGA